MKGRCEELGCRTRSGDATTKLRRPGHGGDRSDTSILSPAPAFGCNRTELDPETVRIRGRQVVGTLAASARLHGLEQEATAGFEPANGGFADLCLEPLGYVAIRAWTMSDGNGRSVTSPRLPVYAIKTAPALATVAYKKRLCSPANPFLPVSQPALSSCSVCGAPFSDARDWPAAHPQADACHVCRRHAPASGRERGLVLGFNRRRRSGFLRASDGRRVFCRGAQVERGRRLRKGDVVAFRRVAGRRGPEAQEVIVEASAADLKAWTARLVAADQEAADNPPGRRSARKQAG